MTTKPLSTYPQDRQEMLALCAKIKDGDEFDCLKAAATLADIVQAILEDEAFGDGEMKKDADALDALLTPRHESEWHEDFGTVLWWRDPIDEAPYIGSPLDCERSFAIEIADGVTLTVKDVPGTGWPGYHEWWTPLPTNEHIGLVQKRIEVAAKARAAEGGSA